MTTADVFRDELARLRARPTTRSARRPLLAVLAVMAVQLVALLPRARTALLSVAGFALLVAGAWTTFGLGAGLAASGVALLVLEYLSDDGPRR